ncbi:MAG: hypothetical protein J0L88_11845 [Xanthomonadales bacterium]|nr:hypothetical protein [Xanthomonadales bacterium]
MTLSTPQRIALFAVLALAMVATRFHHFAVPDASWAVFFIAGFYLRGSARWAFPLLMALAVVVDIVVITGQGLDFWSHYCVSPAYWMLLPAYAALWCGGSWLRSRYAGIGFATLGRLVLALVVAATLCYLVSNGSFYWLSPVVAERSLAGWFKNLGDWYLSFVGTTVAYVGIAAAIHAVATLAQPAPVRAER